MGFATCAVAAGATLVNPGPKLQAQPIAELMESERVTIAGSPHHMDGCT